MDLSSGKGLAEARHLLARDARWGRGRGGSTSSPIHSDDDPANYPPDFDDHIRERYRRVRPNTLSSPERVLALRDSVRYLARAGVPGAIAECGVWRGGSMMVIALVLVEMGDTNRDLFLFDTFTRPPEAGPRDGDGPQVDMEAALANPSCSYIPMEQIRANLEATGYPGDRLHFVVGLVEETIPAQAPDRLALLRLDTDCYTSTAHEMKHLYPRMTPVAS